MFLKPLSIVIGTSLTLTSVASSSAYALPIVSSFTGGNTFTGYYNGSTGDVVGFRFTPTSTGLITHLGILNDPVDSVLNYSHQVGLWETSTQTLLGSVTVDATGTNINNFIYKKLSNSIAVTSGTSYTLGAVYIGEGGDYYVTFPSSINLYGIQNTNGVYPASQSLGFVFPTQINSTNLARLGPNALLTPIPEPITILGTLTALGFGTLFKKGQSKS